jgi:hypothetical protein
VPENGLKDFAKVDAVSREIVVPVAMWITSLVLGVLGKGKLWDLKPETRNLVFLPFLLKRLSSHAAHHATAHWGWHALQKGSENDKSSKHLIWILVMMALNPPC